MTDRQARLRGAFRAALVLSLGLSATACAKHATAAECTTLLDRYVELLVRQDTPEANEETIREQQERTHQKAAKDASFAACPKEVTRSELACALQAPNVDEFEKCLE